MRKEVEMEEEGEGEEEEEEGCRWLPIALV